MNKTIWVNVQINHGVASYSYREHPSGAKASTFHVRHGDQVSWLVRASVDGARFLSPPYNLTFANPAVFNRQSLSVPRGGQSSPLPVVASFGNTKYTLTVRGAANPDDPDIQVDVDCFNRPEAFNRGLIIGDLYTFAAEPSSSSRRCVSLTLQTTGSLTPVPIDLSTPPDIPTGSFLRWTLSPPPSGGAFRVCFPVTPEHTNPVPLDGVFDDYVESGDTVGDSVSTTLIYSVRSVRDSSGDSSTHFSFSYAAPYSTAPVPFNVTRPKAVARPSRRKK